VKGGKPSSDSKPPGYSDPKVISLGAESLLKAVGKKGQAPIQSHPATPTRRSFRWAPSLCSKPSVPSSDSKPPSYSNPKVVSLGAESLLKAGSGVEAVREELPKD
jgi:hypothetical protein